MASKYNNDQEAISEINVVPLVDIILVVLIIFMVTAPMLMKSSISINLPKTANGEAAPPAAPFNITLAGDGKIYLNNKEASLPDILAEAQAQAIKNPEAQVVISADKSVPHGTVVSVMDTVKQGGVKKFAISTEKKQ
jgi:biopolymer transport protein ExbD